MKRALMLVALVVWTLLVFGAGVHYGSTDPAQAFQNGYVQGVKVCLQGPVGSRVARPVAPP